MIVRKGQLSRINCLGWPKSRFVPQENRGGSSQEETEEE